MQRGVALDQNVLAHELFEFRRALLNTLLGSQLITLQPQARERGLRVKAQRRTR